MIPLNDGGNAIEPLEPGGEELEAGSRNED